jgi:transposase-like protein
MTEGGVAFQVSDDQPGNPAKEGDTAMQEKSTEEPFGSRTIWEQLEAMARQRIQEFVQSLLEQEVTELVGRGKSERRSSVDAPPVYRNGHGKPRRLALMSGTITVERPRVRNLEERFESRILPLFCRRTEEVGELLPQLYLHGLAQGDFELALRGLLGEGAPLSPSSIERLRGKWMSAPRLVIADGHLGIWAALAEVFPTAAEQRCWNHKLVNVLDSLPKKKQAEARELLRQIPYAPTRCEAESLRAEFRSLYGAEHPKAAETLERDWERMVAFYGFPKEHWKHLRTTNPVESPFAAVRLRTAAGKRYKKVANATALIWRVLMVAERSFRRLDHPELLPELTEGAIYEDGVRVLPAE